MPSESRVQRGKSKRHRSDRLSTLIFILFDVIILELIIMNYYLLPVWRGNSTGTDEPGKEQGNPSATGYILSQGTDACIVDNDYLEKLAGFHENNATMVYLPLRLRNHIVGGVTGVDIDNAWLGRLAVYMEMIFQSNYRLVIGIESSDLKYLTTDAYAALWKQLNDAFGHRPADQLWYAMEMPVGCDLELWGMAIKDIVKSVRIREEEREVMIILPMISKAKQADEFFENEMVHLAFGITEEISDESFSYLREIQQTSRELPFLLETANNAVSGSLRQSLIRAGTELNIGYFLMD